MNSSLKRKSPPPSASAGPDGPGHHRAQRRGEEREKEECPATGGLTAQTPGRPALTCRRASAGGTLQGVARTLKARSPRTRVVVGGPTATWAYWLFYLGVATVLALTIHRAQGSQFEEVSVVLPPALLIVMAPRVSVRPAVLSTL